MKMLIVAATSKEIEPLLKHYSITPENGFIKSKASDIPDILITGVGAISTTFQLTTILKENTYDLIINAGICGAFDRTVNIGTTFAIKRDCFADIGAEDGDDFLLLTQMNVYADTIGWIYPEESAKTSLPEASAITVNTVTGNDRSKRRWQDFFNPDTESMEGAAVFYVCKKMGAPCLQIRTVSNYVGPRHEAAWDIDTALQNLNSTLIALVKEV